MFSFERTLDRSLVKKIITHAHIYSYVTDDASPDPESWQPPALDQEIQFVVIREDDVVLGCLAFVPFRIDEIQAQEVHICLYRWARGATARKIVASMLDWFFERKPDPFLYAAIPETNRSAIKLARDCGFRDFAVSKNSFRKHGKAVDRILMAAARSTVCR